MKRVAAVCGLAVLLCGSAVRAETVFNFILRGDQVVPPSGSTSWGRAVATLNTAETELHFVIQHSAPTAQSAAVHLGDFGTNGPVVYNLPSALSVIVATWQLSPGDVDNLMAGLLYVQINSSAYPDGDIRGQIAPNPDPQPGDVIISEIMYAPASPEQSPAVAEWIELFNRTYTDIEIGGWFFQDEKTGTVDSCTLKYGGTIPDFLLQAGELLVLLPDGGTPPATVADFKAAWNLGAGDAVLQLNADGTAQGALVYDNLSDYPFNDGNPANDFPLLIEPCDPENPTPHPDVEVLTLNTSSEVMDAVNYDDAGPWPEHIWRWPDCNYAPSIALVPVDYPNSSDVSSFSGTGNDDGTNWVLHAHGDDAGGRCQVASSGVYGGREVGSPCYLFGATSGNQPPTADPLTVLMRPGTSPSFTLTGHDRTRPFFNMLLFVIRSIPENGQLIHVPSGHVVTEEDVAGSGWLVPTMPFGSFRYVNNGTCGVAEFEFQTYDAQLRSPFTKVTLIVQCGQVAITEIMYNPASTEGDPSLPEWVELYNTTESGINLAGWYLEDQEGRCGAFPSYVLEAGATVTVVPSGGSEAEFLQAWSATALRPTVTLETSEGALTGFNLANCGDELRLVQPGGPLVLVSDAVYYGNGGGWPDTTNDGPSIYVEPPASNYDAYANDSGSAWARSLVGTDLAYQNSVTDIYNAADVGSPGRLLGVCGDGYCEPAESTCSCPGDCGDPPATEVPEETCADGLDNDCDGDDDCLDADCYLDTHCVQACCLPGLSCDDTDPADCLSRSGFLRGTGSECLGDLNSNGRDDACEAIPTMSAWGLLSMAVVLAAVGAVVVGRRRAHA